MTAFPPPMYCSVSRIRLPAEPAAAGRAREFARHTLGLWNLADYGDDAELVVSELVANAVKITALTTAEPDQTAMEAQRVIGVQLRFAGFDLYVEVWDRGDGAPAIPEQTRDAEAGRGLFIVESISKHWGSHGSAEGGKVTWAELHVSKASGGALSGSSDPNSQPFAEADEAVKLMDVAFTERVLEGLRQPVAAEPIVTPRRPRRRRTRPRQLNQEPAAVTWAREKAGMTKRSLADAIGVSEQLVGEIESGWRSATPANLEKIAYLLNCPQVFLERKRAEKPRGMGRHG